MANHTKQPVSPAHGHTSAHGAVYQVAQGESSDKVTLTAQTDRVSLGHGYSNLVALRLGARSVLLAYDRTLERTDAYVLTAARPWVTAARSRVVLSGGPWDLIDTFAFGNERYLLTYRADTGTFSVFRVETNLSTSTPYSFAFPRNWPTPGFTTVGAFQSFGGQYLLGYDFNRGKVGIYSLTTTPSSSGGAPPLVGLPVWYHTWAAGWSHFAFFSLGGATYFFKINTKKLNVNIDHVLDSPASGTVEVGSWLQGQLPEAAHVDVAATVPWTTAEPRFLTYVKKNGALALYRIHADCQGWTELGSARVPGASHVVPYQVRSSTYLLFYGG